MTWTIRPYASVGPLAFDMTPAQVAAHVGPPEDTQGNPIPTVASAELRAHYADCATEFRLRVAPHNALPSEQYQTGRVVSFEIYAEIPGVMLHGHDLFVGEKRATLARLLAETRHYAEDEDYVFLECGIAVSKDEAWEGRAFHQRVPARALRPVLPAGRLPRRGPALEEADRHPG